MTYFLYINARVGKITFVPYSISDEKKLVSHTHSNMQYSGLNFG